MFENPDESCTKIKEFPRQFSPHPKFFEAKQKLANKMAEFKI